MKNVFVETSNVKRFLTGVAALEQRGASEACLIVIDGLPGLGKSTTLKHWVAQNGAVYIRAKKEYDAAWFLNDILDSLRVEKPHGIAKKYAKVLAELAMRQNAALLERRPFGLVIDEADHVSSRAAILETIRDISDMIELPTILVGMGKIEDNLKRFPQVLSRVNQKVRFDRLSKDDVARMTCGLCEVKVADCLQDFALKVTQGFNRELLDAITNIEKFGLRFDIGDEGVTMRDMAGQKLVKDRNTGRDIFVPEVV